MKGASLVSEPTIPFWGACVCCVLNVLHEVEDRHVVSEAKESVEITCEVHIGWSFLTTLLLLDHLPSPAFHNSKIVEQKYQVVFSNLQRVRCQSRPGPGASCRGKQTQVQKTLPS